MILASLGIVTLGGVLAALPLGFASSWRDAAFRGSASGSSR
ncbi:hypothetical protein ACFQX6_16400 [Streptosporangium lutulentum]